MYTRRRRSTRKATQKGGRTRSQKTRSQRTQSQKTSIPVLKEEDLTPEEKKLMELFVALPDKLKNTFILNKKILNLRQRAIFKLAMEHRKQGAAVAESSYRGE
jgi:hypothetical protein